MPRDWASLVAARYKNNQVKPRRGTSGIFSINYRPTPSLLQQYRLSQLDNQFLAFQIDLAYHANHSGFAARDGAVNPPIPRYPEEYIDMATSIVNRTVTICVQDLIDRLSSIMDLTNDIDNDTSGIRLDPDIRNAMDFSAVVRLLQAAQERVHRLSRAGIKFEHLSGSAPA